MPLEVRLFEGARRITIQVPPTWTVGQLQAAAKRHLQLDAPPRLSYRGRRLVPRDTLRKAALRSPARVDVEPAIGTTAPSPHQHTAPIDELVGGAADAQREVVEAKGAKEGSEVILPRHEINKTQLQDRHVYVERRRRVLVLPEGHFDPRKFDLPDQFYEATEADVLAHKRSIDVALAIAAGDNRARLAHGGKRVGDFATTTIRVRLPSSRFFLEGIFRPSASVHELYQFVEECLQEQALPVQLYIAPPKTILDDRTATLESLRLVPAAIINISATSGMNPQSMLLPSMLESAFYVSQSI